MKAPRQCPGLPLDIYATDHIGTYFSLHFVIVNFIIIVIRSIYLGSSLAAKKQPSCFL